MGFEVYYKESVYKDLKKIDRKNSKKIMDKIDRAFSGEPPGGKTLKGEYKGLFTFRTGDYRVVYTKIPAGILILRIGRRKDIYKKQK